MPKSSMACGVLATGKSLRVALFTLTSVACAESSTATSSSNALVYSNSVTGRGFAAFKVAKNGSMLSFFMDQFSHATAYDIAFFRAPQYRRNLRHPRALQAAG